MSKGILSGFFSKEKSRPKTSVKSRLAKAVKKAVATAKVTEMKAVADGVKSGKIKPEKALEYLKTV
jgi:hypothetical protein